MGLFDKVKEKAAEIVPGGDANLEPKTADEQAKDENQRLLDIFQPTVEFGDISIDTVNRLFRVKHANIAAPKKSSGWAKAGKISAAVMTVGMSVAAEAAVKGVKNMTAEDKVFHFDVLDSYELLEDDSVTTGGGMGAAVAGGVLFGGLGSIAGGMTGKKSAKKTVDNMILQINTKDIQFPCIMIPYITKSTKVNSKDYLNALTLAKQSIRCLEMIIEDERKTNGDNGNSAPSQPSNESAPADPVAEVKKYKELLDIGAITAEEFEQKKRELLGL